MLPEYYKKEMIEEYKNVTDLIITVINYNPKKKKKEKHKIIINDSQFYMVDSYIQSIYKNYGFKNIKKIKQKVKKYRVKKTSEELEKEYYQLLVQRVVHGVKRRQYERNFKNN